MKRITMLLLCALLAMSVSCSRSRSGEESETTAADPAPSVSAAADESPAEESPETEAPEEGPAEVPENVKVSSIIDLELAKPAVIEGNTLVLYFTDEELWYPEDAACSIGLISSEVADSISGTLDMTSYPDMFDGDSCRGAAIVASEPIPPGSYTFSVSIDNYLVTFDMTVEE